MALSGIINSLRRILKVLYFLLFCLGMEPLPTSSLNQSVHYLIKTRLAARFIDFSRSIKDEGIDHLGLYSLSRIAGL